jgi:hypothetical protein
MMGTDPEYNDAKPTDILQAFYTLIKRIAARDPGYIPKDAAEVQSLAMQLQRYVRRE